MKNKYYYQLVTCEPIIYNSLCFYPISFDTIMQIYGEEYFNFLMLPFRINSEYLKESTGIEISNDDIFENVILKTKEFLENTCNILALFCKCGKITLSNNTLHLYDANDQNIMFDVTRENFDDISDILLTINCKSKIEIEKIPLNMSARQKDVWEKLQAGRKRDAEKNRLHVYDIVKICELGGKFHIPLSEIKQWTMWKLMDTYKAIIAIREYDDSFEIGIAQYDLSAIQNDKHWIKRLMIRE